VFVADIPTPTGGKTALTIVVDNVVADGLSSDSLNALITDANGNPVANTVVTFTIEAGGTATGTAKFNETVTVTTDANGNAAIGLTNTIAGTVNIGAYLNGNIPITGSTQTVTFVNAPDVNNPQTQLVVVIYEAIANGLGNTVVKAHVVDQDGNPIADQHVVFAIDSGSAQIVTPGPWTTDNNGDVSITLTSKTPGNVYVTATVGGKAIKFGSPAKVKFAAINIYVPRVFTPNGDGVNDVLKPILVGISSFHFFSVYNRWGNLIYTTEDPNQGWDGKFKGVAQPVETYLWVAEGIDTEGNKVVQKGMVSLVR
jgi:gliding motility-associated-like protein